MTQRRFLIIALAVLMILIAVLLGFYVKLQAPVTAVDATMPEGLNLEFQLFGPDTSDRFQQPSDVAVSEDGTIFVADTLKDRVCVFGPDGEFIRQFPSGAKRPVGIDVGADGTIYVVSKRSDVVVAFNSKGKLLRHYPAFAPLNVTEEQGRLYITTMGPIVSYNVQSGEDRKLIGWQGRGRDDFAWPTGIDSRNGKLYVADTNNLRLKTVKTDGSVLWVHGKPPTQAKYTPSEGRAFGAPAGIVLDEVGNMLVIDAFRDTIYAFSPSGKQVAQWGGDRGDGEGQFDHPSGIAYAGDGKLVVADKFNDRVQVLRVSIPGNTRSRILSLPWTWCALPLSLILVFIVVYVLRRMMARNSRTDVSPEDMSVD